MQANRLFSTFFLLAVLLLDGSRTASAQIYITEDFLTGQQSRLRIKLLDSLTRDPIPFASVFLKAVGDTVISHFNLTDKEGIGEIEEIPYGGYNVTAEFLGYKPFSKEVYFRSGSVDLGTVLMQEDKEMLEAARVTAAGNPFQVKQDTLIYNASAFHSSDSDMLGDLLKKMPGIEVDREGNVTVNGEKVDKITVQGKTFFFDDPTMAVKNLPAKVVEQVKVIDKKSESEEVTGIVEKDKEKVMDLSLKKEYQKGWFGNVKASAGAPLMQEGEQNDLVDDREVLYNLNLLAAGYNERDQLTVIGNSLNVPEPNASGIVVFLGDGIDTPIQGINTTNTLGINLNTDRIGSMESTGMVQGKSDLTDARSRSHRTTFRRDGTDLSSNSFSDVVQTSNLFRVDFEFKNKKRDKFTFNLTPHFRIGRTSRTSAGSSEISGADGVLNDSRSSTSASSDSRQGGASLDLGLKNLGKEKRALTFSGYLSANGSDGNSSDLSTLRNRFAGTEEVRNLFYRSRNSGRTLYGILTYTEPLAAQWAIQMRLQGNYSSSRMDRSAFDDPACSVSNPYYSSRSDNAVRSAQTRLLLQWSKGQTSLRVGASALAMNNETYSESFGIKTDTGVGEWLWNWAPFLNFNTGRENTSFSAHYNGSADPPSNRRMLPVLDISDPSRISTGNIYLKPSFEHDFSASWQYNNPKTFAYCNVSLYGSLIQRRLVSASWFDEAGIQYAVPVNARKPGWSLSVYPTFSLSLDKDRRWSVSGSFSEILNGYISYQNVSAVAGLDADAFDYARFMKEFWGGPEGDRFYGGQSGFAESATLSSSTIINVELTHRTQCLYLGLGGGTRMGYTHYSLNAKADRTTWDNYLSCYGNWNAPKNFEIKSDMSYHLYRGYAPGYNDPECIWDLTVNKNVKAFTLSLYLKDILNQTRNRVHNATDNYTEDVFRNVLGRYFLIGIKWNFGKMNAAQSQRVQDASWQMLIP